MGNLFSRRKKSFALKSTTRGPPAAVDFPDQSRAGVSEDAIIARAMSMLGAVPGGSAPVHIDVWSDISCPWCHVSKVRLDRAIKNAEAGAGTKLVTVTWHPYIIDLNTNPAGEEYLAYNERRWGSDAWTSSLRKSGAKDGATFKSWKWWPNSLNGHRLINLAETVGKADEAKGMLFNLTYEEGENISNLDVLCSAAEGLGLSNARAYLESDAGKREVLEQDKAAKQKLDIRSVPFFIVNRKFSVSGAMDTDSFQAMIERGLNKPRVME